MNECLDCGFYDEDYGGCICYDLEKWYACPIENKKAENKLLLEKIATGSSMKAESEGVNERNM